MHFLQQIYFTINIVTTPQYRLEAISLIPTSSFPPGWKSRKCWVLMSISAGASPLLSAVCICNSQRMIWRCFTQFVWSCSPFSTQGHLREGKCHMSLGNAMAASRCFQKVLELDLNNKEAKQEVGTLLKPKIKILTGLDWIDWMF